MKNLFLMGLFSLSILSAQTTLYSEDFEDSNNDNKGQNGTTFDMSGVTNWSLDVNGNTFSSGDYAKQTSGRFEVFNSDASNAASGVLWYSLEIDISCYTNVTLSTVLSRISSNSGSGVRAFYILDGGAPVLFGSLTGSGATPTVASVAGLSGLTVQIVVSHWGTNSTPRYSHDDVSIVGTFDPSACSADPGAPSCGGDFTDSDLGSAAGTYASNLNDTTYICPDNPGDSVKLVFREVDLGANDFLYIYEGNPNGNLLYTVSSADNGNVFTIVSAQCIAAVWITNGVDDGNEGFWAGVDCSARAEIDYIAADDFADATLICDLGVYEGSTFGYGADVPFDLKPSGNCSNCGDCPTVTFKGSIENNSWFKFIATSTSIDLLVTPGSCQVGFGGGIQMAIFAFDGSSFTRLTDCSFTQGGESVPFTLTATPLTPGEVYYIMVDGNAASRCEYTIQMTSGFSGVTANSSDDGFCVGGFSELSAVGGDGGSYIWFDDSGNGSYEGNPITVFPETNTTYTVLNTGACAGATDAITVTVDENCVVLGFEDYELSGERANVADDLTFVNYQPNHLNTYQFETSVDGLDWISIAQFGQTEANLIEFQNGQITDKNYYRVRVQDQNGNVDYSNTIVLNGGRTASLEFYPNPGSNVLNVRNYANEASTVEVYDVSGKLVYQSEIMAQEVRSISIADWAQGMYIINYQDIKGKLSSSNFIKL